MLDATFVRPDLGAFCRLDELGLEVVGQRLEPDRAVLACRVEPGEFDRWCRRCGGEGAPRDSVTREFAHEPFGWRATTLQVTIRRYRCVSCSRVWRQDTSKAAEPRARLSRRGLRWALEAIVVQHLTVARIAEALAVSWNTANNAVLAEGKRVLISDPHRLAGVKVVGVDEHCWRHTRKGDKYVTVIIDLTPVREGTGPARLLDMVEGRSKQVFTSWLDTQTPQFRNGIEVVAMDGFTGFKTAAAETVPDAVAVMDPFHVVALAGDALDRCRQRVQQETRGHRGHTGDPLYGIRRVLRTGADLLTDRQRQRLDDVFADDRHVEVQATWSVYQRIVAAYRNTDRAAGKTQLRNAIDAISTAVPTDLDEVITLGRTLKRRAVDVLAYFDRPGTSNGPTEAINGRLEHLRGSALGFRNLTNYIARSLLETGGFRPRLHPHSG
ncbi:MAG TPA: ISL3 family transposase [Jatrophihabitans sp.]|uniref:ISL3 family transposase n=1 Tax=Jatrophihabitans sp. TaxID=1932789 RepID=UPI002DFCEFD6|nr:ISL3 family transposase [Jatrophihabitans sp.]